MMAVNRPEKAADGEMAADKYKRLGERLFRIAPDGLERGKMFELVSCQQVGSRFHVVEWASPVWRCHDSFRIEQGKSVEIGRAHAELQSLMRISSAVFCLKKQTTHIPT